MDMDRISAGARRQGINRGRFLGLASLWTGAVALTQLAALRGVRARRSGSSGAAPVIRARQFVDRFDRQPPFSFLYGRDPSSALLARWQHAHTQTTLDANRTEHTFIWTDPATALQVRCVAVAY